MHKPFLEKIEENESDIDYIRQAPPAGSIIFALLPK